MRLIPANLHLRLHVGLSALFVPVVLLTGLGIAVISYRRSSELLLKANEKLMAAAALQTTAEVLLLLDIDDVRFNLLRLESLSRASSLRQRLSYLSDLRRALKETQSVTSYFAGYSNGDRFQLRQFRGDRDRAQFKAPSQAHYALQTNEVRLGTSTSKVLFFDRNLRLVLSRAAPEFASFDPRIRPWYKAAIVTNKPIITDVYRFDSTGDYGLTLAQRAPNGPAVIGADLNLSTLQGVLQSKRVTPGTRLALVDAQGGGDRPGCPDPEGRPGGQKGAAG